MFSHDGYLIQVDALELLKVERIWEEKEILIIAPPNFATSPQKKLHSRTQNKT